jgi:hypothetical protein
MTTKQYIVAGMAAALMAGELITGAPPASAGCVDPGWSAHPFAQMCDSPVNSEGWWDRCVTFHNGGPLSPAETDCYIMSPGNPPPGDPELGTPPTHIDD